PETPRRHRVQLRSFVFVEGHLDAGNALPAEKFVHRTVVRHFIVRTMRSEQSDAVARPTGVVAKAPVAARIEVDNALDPTRTIQVGQLDGEAKDGLKELAGEGSKI